MGTSGGGGGGSGTSGRSSSSGRRCSRSCRYSRCSSRYCWTRGSTLSPCRSSGTRWRRSSTTQTVPTSQECVPESPRVSQRPRSPLLARRESLRNFRTLERLRPSFRTRTHNTPRTPAPELRSGGDHVGTLEDPTTSVRHTYPGRSPPPLPDTPTREDTLVVERGPPTRKREGLPRGRKGLPRGRERASHETPWSGPYFRRTTRSQRTGSHLSPRVRPNPRTPDEGTLEPRHFPSSTRVTGY